MRKAVLVPVAIVTELVIIVVTLPLALVKRLLVLARRLVAPGD